MKKYILDANALVRLYRDTPGADKVEGLVRQAKAGQAHLSISVVNLGETLYILARYFGERQARQCIQKTRNAVAIVSVDEQAALDAAMLRFRYKLSFADSFAAELAMRDGATLVTADPDFDKLGRQLRLLTLPRYSA